MTGVQTCALPICFPVTIASTEESHQGSDIEQEEESSIEELEKKLSEALENEDYELAARLRDELNKRK